MKKFRVTCYPNQNSYQTEVEAETIQDAIEQAEEEAWKNCGFSATEDDVVELTEEEDV